ncbi:MAG TPA: sulfatase, partial [Pirellulaceae bacterium]|nr:sulfatase [Pirellulaceae bacterium]
TFAALANHTPSTDPKWDGTNIWPVLADNKPLAPRPLYWTAPGFRASAVRLGDWKLIATGSGDAQKVELFDLASDPNETTDLAAKMPDKVAQLKAKLAELAARDRDAVAKD